MIRFSAALLAILLSDLAPAQEAPAGTANALDGLRQTVGQWQGELEYRDYSSDREVRLPARLTSEVSDDGDFVTWRFAFSDPGRAVRSFDVMTVDPAGGELVAISFAQRRAERMTYRLAAISDADAPRIEATASGTDNGRAATIRLTLSLGADALSVQKDVRYDDSEDDTWIQRNELRLQRVKTPPALALVGTWRLDLRPTPDAPTYFQDMVLELDDDGELRGTFYDSPITAAHINRDWGELRFAFVTNDGSGPYYTTGVLRNGRVEGTTLSTGRDFLSVWRSERK